MAASSKCFCLARDRCDAIVSRGEPELDQSRFNLYARLGVVMSEVNKITPDGLPVLLIEKRSTGDQGPGFQLTRPEIFMATKRKTRCSSIPLARIDYPSGDQNKYSPYQGTGGFPVGSFLLKVAAAISEGGGTLFSPVSHRREPHDDPSEGAGQIGASDGFLQWDQDPYLVITTTADWFGWWTAYDFLSHPYSATLPVAALNEGANYIRNAVKATVDAYTGKISL